MKLNSSDSIIPNRLPHMWVDGTRNAVEDSLGGGGDMIMNFFMGLVRITQSWSMVFQNMTLSLLFPNCLDLSAAKSVLPPSLKGFLSSDMSTREDCNLHASLIYLFNRCRESFILNQIKVDQRSLQFKDYIQLTLLSNKGTGYRI